MEHLSYQGNLANLFLDTQKCGCKSSRFPEEGAGGGGGGSDPKSSIRGGSAPRSKPLPFNFMYHFGQGTLPFYTQVNPYPFLDIQPKKVYPIRAELPRIGPL